jgi:hypothetical protein
MLTASFSTNDDDNTTMDAKFYIDERLLVPSAVKLVPKDAFENFDWDTYLRLGIEQQVIIGSGEARRLGPVRRNIPVQNIQSVEIFQCKIFSAEGCSGAKYSFGKGRSIRV